MDKIRDGSKWNYTIIDNSILETDALDIYEKMLYISLKRYANIHTDTAFPGAKKLALHSRMSERKVRSTLNQLEEKKFISVERRLNNTSIYTLLDGTAHGAGGAQRAGGVVHTVQGGGAHRADELKRTELKREELQLLTFEEYPSPCSVDETKSTTQTEKTNPFVEIINYLNVMTGKNFKHTTKATKSLIKARMDEGFTVDDFKKVIETKCREWMTDVKMSRYLKPDTLFSTKFEGYLNQNVVSTVVSNDESSFRPDSVDLGELMGDEFTQK